jgi:hypothetical protein
MVDIFLQKLVTSGKFEELSWYGERILEHYFSVITGR